MRRVACLALSLALAFSAFAARPTTTGNDDSCDIGLSPAATLLLPYFEVAVDDPAGENTLFTITNTGRRAQVARVTLWTDYAYPVLTFDVYLTGYDVQSISLYDVLNGGILGGDRGTGVEVSPRGKRSRKNPLLDASNCNELPDRLDAALLSQLRAAFYEGVAPGCPRIGGTHENAVGYATVDVVGNCAPGRGPTDTRYFSEDIRYDNVLIGDSMQLNAGQAYARAAPMVRIRALPGWGTPKTRMPGPMPRLEKTFYGRFQDPADPHLDARQPLPSTFALRWFEGGDADTTLQIWREGYTGRTAACTDYDDNGKIVMAESVAFDEDENGEGFSYSCVVGFPCYFPEYVELPATSAIPADDDDLLPQDVFEEHASGWLYLNLDDGNDRDGRGAHQNWVTVTMRAQGIYSASFDAAWLGNGCSPAVEVTKFSERRSTVMPGPADDVNP